MYIVYQMSVHLAFDHDYIIYIFEVKTWSWELVQVGWKLHWFVDMFNSRIGEQSCIEILKRLKVSCSCLWCIASHTPLCWPRVGWGNKWSHGIYQHETCWNNSWCHTTSWNILFAQEAQFRPGICNLYGNSFGNKFRMSSPGVWDGVCFKRYVAKWQVSSSYPLFIHFKE